MGSSVTEVNLSGPLFDGRARHAVRALIDEAKWAVGQSALAEVHQLLDRSIRHPTPYYETQITIQRLQEDVVVHDRGIIYGPWLEGTGSRNRTTRFKGYASFRRATQATQAKVGTIVDRVVGHHLADMQ